MWLSGTPTHPAATPVQLCTWAGLCSEHEGLVGSRAECCGTAGLCVSAPLSLLGPVWPVPFCCLPWAPSLPFSCHEGGAWPLVLLEACSEEASSVQPQHPTSAHFKSACAEKLFLLPPAPACCSPCVEVCLCTEAMQWALCPRLCWLHCGKGAADPTWVLPPFPWQWAPQHHPALS